MLRRNWALVFPGLSSTLRVSASLICRQSRHGYMQSNTVVLLSVLACLLADGLWFWLGRKWGSQVMRVLCRLTTDPRRCSRDAHDRFSWYGLPLLCVAKFIPGLDGLMPPLAGAEAVFHITFLALDAIGSLIWSSFYVGGRIRLLRTIGNRGCLGETLWRCPNPWDRRSILSVRRLARTDFDTNDSPTAGPPHKCTDAVSKAESGQQGRVTRSPGPRGRGRH